MKSEKITCYDGEVIVIDDAKRKKIEEITQEVLKEIKPSPEEQVQVLTSVSKVMKGIKEELGNDVNFTLGGSVGKNTNLR